MIFTQEQLIKTFCDNFVAYSRAHIAHINVVGRNFQSDHALLGEIYEYLEDNIDTLGELVRSVGAFVPDNLSTITVDSRIDDEPMRGPADAMLEGVRDDLVRLVESYRELSEVASEDEAEEIENFAQEHILAINKLLWKLDSTLMPE